MDQRQRENYLRLRSLLNTPGSDLVELADCYVQLLGEQLHILARTAYEHHGRGLIEIDLRGIDLRVATGHVPIAYYPTADAADDWPANIDQVLSGYDPRDETVVLLYQDRCEPLVYVLQ